MPCMYNKDIQRNYMSLICIKNHHSEDSMKSAKFRERAAALNNMIDMWGYKHVQDKSTRGNYTFIEHWEHVVNGGSVTKDEH